ncbi:flagellar hook-length control protein FliK [Amantichitinum ursilacus]|uniref:Flagellar hook-length control protein n=1 Tax=Amantichitinum ursilacus TaxID=857265 RepID=A0A0N1JRU0_9NEIS|nr:flagellar hook-length control protein FliK [Amantichitinum ursilacus]KPC50264.1 Flagellar hook-length control protein [Amantichitinum ursilacus]
MAAANAINTFAATPSPSSSSSSSKSGSSDQSFSASLADAKQIVHMQHAQQQSNAQDSNKQNASSDDGKAAATSSGPINDASKDAGGAADTAQTVAPWLALLQAQLAQQAAPQDPTADTSASAQQITDVLDASKTGSSSATSAKTLSALLASQKDDTAKADPKEKASDLLKALQADSGKQAAKADDLAADGKDLPLTLGVTDKDGDAAQGEDQANASALSALTGGTSARAHAATAAQATPTTRTVAEPVGSDKWGAAVAQQVSIMVGKQEQHMEMQLNPPNLGPMEVKLSMAQDQASVIFTSQHANVREALAAATPRLTALLADQGITLTNVQVASDSLNQQAQQQAQQQQQSGSQRRNSGVFGNSDDTTTVTRLTDVKIPVARSGLNLFV